MNQPAADGVTLDVLRTMMMPWLESMGVDLTIEDVALLAMTAYLQSEQVAQKLAAYEGRGSEHWLTVRDVMERTGMSKSTVHRAIRSGDLRSKRVGGRRLVERASVELFLRFRSLCAGADPHSV